MAQRDNEAGLDLTAEAFEADAADAAERGEVAAEPETAVNETGKPPVAIKNPVLVRKAVELKAQGRTISQISRELDLSRPTVRKYLKDAGAISSNYQEQLASITKAITDEAYKSIHAQIVDRNAKGDGRLALDWMKMTVYAEKRAPIYNMADDRTMQTLMALLPARPAAAAAVTVNVKIETGASQARAITVESSANPIPDTRR